MTPIALPGELEVWVDARVMACDWVILGGGDRSHKINLLLALSHPSKAPGRLRQGAVPTHIEPFALSIGAPGVGRIVSRHGSVLVQVELAKRNPT